MVNNIFRHIKFILFYYYLTSFSNLKIFFVCISVDVQCAYQMVFKLNCSLLKCQILKCIIIYNFVLDNFTLTLLINHNKRWKLQCILCLTHARVTKEMPNKYLTLSLISLLI